MVSRVAGIARIAGRRSFQEGTLVVREREELGGRQRITVGSSA